MTYQKSFKNLPNEKDNVYCSGDLRYLQCHVVLVCVVCNQYLIFFLHRARKVLENRGQTDEERVSFDEI